MFIILYICDLLRENRPFAKIIQEACKVTNVKKGYLTSNNIVLEMEFPVLSLYCDQI